MLLQKSVYTYTKQTLLFKLLHVYVRRLQSTSALSYWMSYCFNSSWKLLSWVHVVCIKQQQRLWLMAFSMVMHRYHMHTWHFIYCICDYRYLLLIFFRTFIWGISEADLWKASFLKASTAMYPRTKPTMKYNDCIKITMTEMIIV